MKTYTKTFAINAEDCAEKEAIKRLELDIIHTDFVESYWRKQIELERSRVKNDIRQILESFNVDKVFNVYFVTDLVKKLKAYLNNSIN